MYYCTNDPLYNKLRRQYAGSRIKLRRAELAISRDFLADSIGIDSKELSSYENGEQELPADVAFWLCKVLHTNLEYFYKDFKQTFS